jgi:hypothetical protein
LNDLLEHLKSALADRYKIERRLGEGGMASDRLNRPSKSTRGLPNSILSPTRRTSTTIIAVGVR